MKVFLNKETKDIVIDINDVAAIEGYTELKANDTDGAKEKHVPVVERNKNEICVKVGSVAHPMLVEHFIEFILLETENGFQVRYLIPGDKPEAKFVLAENERAIAVYEYCNLHGLWKAKVM